MTEFTPVSALVGGAIIGAAAVMFMALVGRIAGISGIAGGLLAGQRGDFAWRLAFVVGLAAAPLAWQAATGAGPVVTMASNPVLLVAAGLLVGFGAQLGSGCTSGHGVCGISRFSARSILATVTFIATAAATVFVMRHLVAGV